MLMVSYLVNFKTVLSRSALGAVAGWVPREADSETEVNMREVIMEGLELIPVKGMGGKKDRIKGKVKP